MTDFDKGRLPSRAPYQDDKEKIQEFFTTYKDENGDLKYQALLDEISDSNINRKDLPIDLNDISTFSAELASQIRMNADTYLELFYQVSDSLIPQENSDFSNQLEAINTARRQANNASGNSSGHPPELFRKHTIRFIPEDKQPQKPMRDIRATDIGALVRIRGIVTRVTQVKPLMRVAAYTCDQCEEESTQVIEGPTFLPKVTCPSEQCKSAPRPGNLVLQTRSSKFLSFQMIKMQELSSEVPAGHIPRSMTVYARETLTNNCQAGDVICVDGIFKPIPIRSFRQSLISETFIEAQSINVAPKYGPAGIIQTDDDDIELDGNYEQLAASIAPEIYGHEDVKRALLLQLIGGTTKSYEDGIRIRGDINICLMGDPGVAKSQLLKWVARISPRAIYTTGRGSSGVGLTAAVLKDPVTGETALEGGALVLADNGICCIDEFDKMEDSDRTAIYEVMEQQTVSIAKAGITTTLNARTSLLAAANPLYSRYNVKRSLLENVNLPAALLSRFDLLFLLLDQPTVESDTALANHIAFVHKNREAPQMNQFDINKLRKHIEKAKTFEPIIPEDLVRYISAAFVSMRQETVDEPVTARSLLAIIRLSFALAKIRFSEIVSNDDVDEALRLFKTSKESIEVGEQEKEKRVDATDAIYEKINAIRYGHQTIKISDIKNAVLKSGYTSEQLDQTLATYEKLGVWQLHPNGTKLTFNDDE